MTNKCSQLTKIKNYLEASASIAADQEMGSDTLEQLKHLIELADQAARLEFKKSLDVPAASVKQRIIYQDPQGKLKFYQDWERDEWTLEPLVSKVSSLVHWQWPALEIFPGTGQVVRSHSGAEPMYIADWDQMLLDSVAEKFNEFFSTRRLMQYVIKDYDLSNLPQRSFGTVYTTTITRWEDIIGLNTLAKSVYELLLDGGHYLFTFNPLDKWYGVRQVEISQAYGAYTNDLIESLTTIGFELVELYLNDSNNCYMLVKRPGQLEHIKAGSILPKIIDRTNDLL